MSTPDPIPPAQGLSFSRRLALAQHRWARLPPGVRGLVWAAGAGLSFTVLNTFLRALSLQLHPMQAQFLRYLMAVVVMLPLVVRAGPLAYWPRRVGPQFARGGVHALGLVCWFMALPQISLAATTAISFTTPLFVMLGAWFFFKEAMRWERWLATAIGFAGVMVVVAPGLTGRGGAFNLLMLASSPMFAASYLLTKALTRHDRAPVIVLWQAISISLFSLPAALWFWQAPSLWQWGGFVLSGLLGVSGHYCLTRSFEATDISATQSVKFLDLVWATALGWLAFSELPTRTTLIGGLVICASTVWIGLRESRSRRL
jgi:drug/metabolite transporter (DMT)-like permease